MQKRGTVYVDVPDIDQSGQLGPDGRGSCYHMMAFQKHTPGPRWAEMKRTMDGLNFLPDTLYVYNKNSAVRESRGPELI